MRITWKLLLTLSVVFSGIIFTAFKGCNYKEPELVEIQSIEFLEQKDTLVEIRIVSVIRNHNLVGAQISNMSGKLSLDGAWIANINSEQKWKLKSKDTTWVPLMASVSLPHLSAIFPTVMEKDSAKLFVDAHFWVDFGVSNFKIKKSIVKNIDIKAELRKQMDALIQNAFKLKQISPRRIGIDTTILSVDFQFENPLGIEFVLDRANVNLSLKNQDKSFGYWELLQPIRLSPKESKRISGEIQVGNSELFRQGIQSIFGGPLVVHAKGTAHVLLGVYDFQIEIDQQMEMLRAAGF